MLLFHFFWKLFFALFVWEVGGWALKGGRPVIKGSGTFKWLRAAVSKYRPWTERTGNSSSGHLTTDRHYLIQIQRL